LARYLEYARVVADGDNAAITRTEEAVTRFLKIGIELQKKLEKIAERDDNWVNRYWLPEMYLKIRLPLPMYSSPVYVFPRQTFNNLNEQLNYTAWLVRGIAEYKDLIDRRLVEREMSTGMNKVRMCMWQYDRVLGCYREPGSPVDIQHFKKVPPPTANPNWNEHVLVMCNNQAFIMSIRVDGELLAQPDIRKQLDEIVRMSENRPGGTVIPIGAATVGYRDDAAKFWSIMKEVPQNEETLALIRSAAFGVCIDRDQQSPKPTEQQPEEEEEEGGGKSWYADKNNEMSYALAGQHLLHGFGSSRAGLNRWYDTTIQVIVSSNGINGLLIEHSVVEGIVIINMGEYALRLVEKFANSSQTSQAAASANRVSVTPKALTWYVSPSAKMILRKEIEVFDRLAKNLELRVLEFKDFGKNFIKSCAISPDGFVQLSMQLAYYRLHGRLVSTYESASIRRFLQGRVDNIRAATPEALLWVETMMSRRKSLALKRKLFEEAAKKQALMTVENISGFGIDNHLCALYVLASEQVRQGKLPRLPDIFTDPFFFVIFKSFSEFVSFKKFPHSNFAALLTTPKTGEWVSQNAKFPDIFFSKKFFTANGTTFLFQVTTTVKNTYLCYGPVVDDGYGCSYNIQADSIIYAPSAYRSCKSTDVDKFKGALVESLRDMKMLVTGLNQ
uniref:Choline O-acetyltransferase n=1 Tax=Anisakis simplex TaxID=6269 RepID=A0A0M3K6B8_ANISI